MLKNSKIERATDLLNLVESRGAKDSILAILSAGPGLEKAGLHSEARELVQFAIKTLCRLRYAIQLGRLHEDIGTNKCLKKLRSASCINREDYLILRKFLAGQESTSQANKTLTSWANELTSPF